MKTGTENLLKQGLATAFIDNSISSNLAYKPQFISNDYKLGHKVLSSIEDELLKCHEFYISVAFITMGGITPLLQTLKELENKGIYGRILTTDYLLFTEPKALETLHKLSNLEIKIFSANKSKEGFHTKGYVFKNDEIYRIIIGSSNMTLNALTVNREWNTRIVSTDQGEYAKDLLAEFDRLWLSEEAKEYSEYIDEYAELYTKNKIVRRQKKIVSNEETPSLEAYRLQPNSMQLRFIQNLKEICEKGADRALLISATGTGKTYASAFAMRELGFKRVLFLVHRNQIAKQTIRSYRNVFGSNTSMGLLTGGSEAFDEDYIFATIQTLGKDEVIKRFDKHSFDAIIIDEYGIIGQVKRRPILKAS